MTTSGTPTQQIQPQQGQPLSEDTTLEAALKHHFGYKQFRFEQRHIIEQVLKNQEENSMQMIGAHKGNVELVEKESRSRRSQKIARDR